MPSLTLYTRPGCHLCDDMKQVVRRVAQITDERIAIDEVDISGNADLEARYGVEIPVLLLNGRKIAKYRIEEDALRRVLEGLRAEG